MAKEYGIRDKFGLLENVSLHFNRVSGTPPALQNLCKYLLNGTNSYITYGNILNTTFAAANPSFTIETWFKRNTTGFHDIVSKLINVGNQRSFSLRVDASDKIIWLQSSNGTAIIYHTSNDTFTDITNWNHLAVTIDYSQATFTAMVSIYLNGYKIPTTPNTSTKATIFASTAPLTVGVIDSTTTPIHFLDGDVRNLVITERVKDAAEILADYNIGNIAEPNPNGLVLYSDFKTDTWDGTKWLVQDLSVNNLDGQTVNVLESDHICENVEILVDVI